MIGLPNPWVILFVLAAIGAAGWQGYRWGDANATARHVAAKQRTQKALFDAGEQLSRDAARLEARRNDLEDLARRLEREAQDDPDGLRPGVGADGLRRIQQRWSAARSATASD